MNRLKLALLLFVAMPLSACASSHLIVEQPNQSQLRTQEVTLVYNETTTGVPQDAVAFTQREMEEAFITGPHAQFRRGGGMTVRYRWVGFDRGNRMARYFAGTFGAGEAQMVLEAEFLDPEGHVMARVRGQGEMRMGFFGGSSNSAIKRAVREIRDYAVAHFRG